MSVSVDPLAALIPSLSALHLRSHAIEPTEGTGKRKIDGLYAETRLGQFVTDRWANERFRQVMVLVREFRMEWPNKTLLTADDVEVIRVALDVALASAIRQAHVGDIYDLNPTTWSIWLVQHTKAIHRGGWSVDSEVAQDLLSFEYLYRWLEVQHERGDRWSVYDPSTRQLLHRYKLPFKSMRVPPKKEDLFKWRKGASRLSKWMELGELPPLDPAIQNQLPPRLVAPPPLQAERERTRQALWSRVARQARQRQLLSVDGESNDARFTQKVVASVMIESREISDADFEDAEKELEQDQKADEREYSVLTDEDGEKQSAMSQNILHPPPPPDHTANHQQQKHWHINELLAELLNLG